MNTNQICIRGRERICSSLLIPYSFPNTNYLETMTCTYFSDKTFLHTEWLQKLLMHSCVKYAVLQQGTNSFFNQFYVKAIFKFNYYTILS